MKEIPITWTITGVKGVEVNKLADLYKVEQTSEVKAALDHIEQTLANWWVDQAEKYLNNQTCTYEEKVKALDEWKASLNKKRKEVS